MARTGGFRLSVVNENVPNMVGQITSALAEASLNIIDLLNKSRGDLAYTVIDLNAPIPGTTLDKIRSITGVLSVRAL